MTMFEAKLREFEEYHLSMSNRLSHYAGLSMVTIGILGLLHQIEVANGISAAWVLLGVTLVFDLVTWHKVAIPVFIAGSIYLAVASIFSVWTNLAIFSVGLIIQIAAHKVFERNEPAFKDNLIHNHIGPRWLVIQFGQLLGFQFGYKNHLRLNTDVADLLRWSLNKLVPLVANAASKKMLSKVGKYQLNQIRLREAYCVEQINIQTYSEDLRDSIIQKQKRLGGSFAFTSGSTSKPKQILYTPERLQLFKVSSASSSLQCFRLMQVTNPSLFIFASLQKDDSFASLVVSTEEKSPGFISGIIEPAKYLNHPLVKIVAQKYGANGARLWVMAMNSPGIFYATNPSTLAVFFDDIDTRWSHYRQLFCDFLSGCGGFESVNQDPRWYKLICGLGRGDYAQRIRALSECAELPAFNVICPDLKGYICWDGGYVTGFLGKVLHYLPADRYMHIPMFSMSTETLQTELLVTDDTMHFLPTADKVLYEFLPLECSDEQVNELLLATQLTVGHSYTMIVSDPWGLQRYQTQDVFKCVDRVKGVADIRFQKRRGLNYSFTGEKITGEQVEEAIQLIVEANPVLRQRGVQFTLIPSRPKTGNPHYLLLVANSSCGELESVDQLQLASDFNAYLKDINHEYRDKVESGRLENIECLLLPYDDAALLLDPKTNKNTDVENRSWESQFKLTPITTKLWQSLPTDRLKLGSDYVI